MKYPGVVPIVTPSLKKTFFSVSSTILRPKRRAIVDAGDNDGHAAAVYDFNDNCILNDDEC